MKARGWFMTLPLVCAAGVAMAQGDGQDSASMQREAGKAQETVTVRHPVREDRPKRQGEDMRRCLKLKTDAAIIRCAESGRRP